MWTELKVEGFLHDDEPEYGLVILSELNSKQRFAMRFGLYEALYIRAALEHHTSDDLLYAHGRQLQILHDHFETTLMRVTIPRLEQRGQDNGTFVTVCHFQTPRGPLDEEYVCSDALSYALYAACPLLMDADLLKSVADRQRIVGNLDEADIERPSRKKELLH